MGTVAPLPGFNEGLQALTREHGALLIMDEVMTGFRVSASGWYGIDGVAGDLYTFGKVMSGGLPAAAFGGRADVMAHLAPAGPVYQAGTLSGNPVAVAAGLASLRAADAEVYAALDRNAATLGRLLGEALTAEGVPHRVQYAGTMVSVFFTENPVTNYDEAKAAQTWRFPAFFHALLDRGVYAPPSAFEAWFVSAALDDDAFSRIADALPHAARPQPLPRPRPDLPPVDDLHRPDPIAPPITPRNTRRDRRRTRPRPAPSCTCSGTVRCTTPTASCTAASPDSGCR